MCGDEFFLAIHSSFWAKQIQRWGLPGGNIERREEPEYAVRRELEEELNLFVPDFVEIGAFRYKGHEHMVFGAEIFEKISSYDDSELLDIGWYNLNEINQLEQDQLLHAGYELEAIETFLELI